jgi:AraC-like DNA-binding protein
MLPSPDTVEYTESAPPPALASIVRCVWTLNGHARDLAAAIQPVLPDGCPELVVHLGDAFERVYQDGTVERQPAVLVAGQLTGQLALRATGRIAVVGVRFQPDGAATLLPVPQRELAGLTVSVDDVLGPLARSLGEVRGSTESTCAASVAILERLSIHTPAARVDARVRRAVQIIEGHRGRVSIDRLARHVGLTRRHLERRFQIVVGVSPKRLARIARFQHALRMLHALEAGRRGTRTAIDCGYADQAHFVREFRELAGCPPEAHLLRDAELNGFFSGQP